MRTTQLPPQAYTRDILNKAFLWFKDQPDKVKAKATTTDAMVSYYLRHKRTQETTDSANAFRDDLKSLSKGFDDFENLNQPSKSNSLKTTEEHLNEFEATFVDPVIEKQEELEMEIQIKEKVKQAISSQSFTTATPTQEPIISAPVTPTIPAPIAQAPRVRTPQNPPVQSPISKPDADLQTQKMVQDTLNCLNLSSKDEAIRVLIGLGYGHIKQCFPKK